MGVVIEHSVDVLEIGFVVLALDGIDRDLIVANQRRGHVILGAQRVAGAQHDICAACLQTDHQISRLRGYVHTGADA